MSIQRDINDDDDVEPKTAKKLRFSDPDLKVVLGGGDSNINYDDDNDNTHDDDNKKGVHHVCCGIIRTP